MRPRAAVRPTGRRPEAEGSELSSQHFLPSAMWREAVSPSARTGLGFRRVPCVTHSAGSLRAETGPVTGPGSQGMSVTDELRQGFPFRNKLTIFLTVDSRCRASFLQHLSSSFQAE